MPQFGLGRPDVIKLKAKKNIDGLIKALSYDDIEIRRTAALALGKIGTEKALEPLEKCLAEFKQKNSEMQLSTLVHRMYSSPDFEYTARVGILYAAEKDIEAAMQELRSRSKKKY
jgi:hypothetical protein